MDDVPPHGRGDRRQGHRGVRPRAHGPRQSDHRAVTGRGPRLVTHALHQTGAGLRARDRGSSVQILAVDGGVMLLEIEVRRFKYWLWMGVLCCWK